MPKNQMTLDTNMPDLLGDKPIDQKLAQIQDYLWEMTEQQRYLMGNLDARNFNETGLAQIGDQIRKPIYGELKDLEGNLTKLKATAGELSAQMADVEGNVSSLKATAKELSSKITSAEGRLTEITQKVNSIRLHVANGDKSATIELKAGEAVISSQTISMKGLVTFNDLKAEGATTINGSNITTGTLNAEYVKLKGKFEVYNGNVKGGYIGYMSGSTGSQTTNGIGVCNSAGDCYAVATDAGVALTAGGYTVFIAKQGGLRTNAPVVISGDLTVNGTVRAWDIIKTGKDGNQP